MNGNPPTALGKLLSLMASGQWHKAIRLAARWPQLGEHRATIKQAAAALLSPGFYAQLGKDPDELVRLGVNALKARYGHHLQQPAPATGKRTTKEPVMTTETTRKVWTVSKAVRELASKAQLKEFEALMPELQAEVGAVTSLAKAATLRSKYLAMPKGDKPRGVLYMWRMQHLDALAIKIRALKGNQQKAVAKLPVDKVATNAKAKPATKAAITKRRPAKGA